MGTIEETLFSKELKFLEKKCISQGAVTHINDGIGFHQMGNPTTQSSITLHCYIPSYETCHVFDPKDDPKDFYSWEKFEKLEKLTLVFLFLVRKQSVSMKQHKCIGLEY